MGARGSPPGGPRALVAVLAGGRGARLGQAKPAAPLAGRPLLSYPLAAARAAGLRAVVIAKPSSPLPPVDEPVVLEPERPRHPLCGVLAALAYAAEPAAGRRPAADGVVTVACDMPLVSPALLAWLASLPEPAVAVQAQGRLQPLLARLAPTHVPALQRALRERSSMREAIARLQPRVIAEDELQRFGDPRRLCFNVNDAQDLRTAERWLQDERAMAQVEEA